MFKCLACGLPWWLSGKESACQVGDAGSTPEWGRSPGEGNGIPPQSSHLGNPMDRGAWPASLLQLFRRLWLCDPMDCSTLPCPSPSPRACSNSCPLSQWCHPTISSSVASFSSCLQSFPASGSFPVSQLFASGGQSIGASASVQSVGSQS